MQGIQMSFHYVGARVDIALLTISGYIDTTTCQEMAKTIQELIKQKKVQIIADLGRVTYISSAGWGVFVGEIKNVREQGGDIKIVQMIPEVFDVFEMLEFNKILNYYESVEEAIDEFDIIRGIDITQNPRSSIEMAVPALPREKIPVPVHIQERRKILDSTKSEISYKGYPVVERIKRIVIENPTAGLGEIRKKLRTEKYGNVKMGYLKLFALLRTLSLETREKRFRFYRSR
jgi:anti-sigma B factor antagonist